MIQAVRGHMVWKPDQGGTLDQQTEDRPSCIK